MKKLYIITILTMLLLVSAVSAETQIASDDFECNGFSCGTGWNGAWTQGIGCEISTLASPLDLYQARCDDGYDMVRTFDNAAYNDVNVSFYATAASLEVADTCIYYYYDGSTYTELLTLANGDDDGSLDFYSYNVTQYGVGTNAGIRMLANSGLADWCYLDNVSISGEVGIELNIYTASEYIIGETDVVIEADSSLTNTQHTIELQYPDTTVFCTDTITSPSVPGTVFSTTCDMLNTTQTNAIAKLYVTGSSGESVIQYFNISQAQQDAGKLDIKKIYYSPQVLQGGSTEIYAVLTTGSGITLDKITTTVNFPDGTSRVFGMSETVNPGEYRAFISDTYQTGPIYFNIKIEAGTYYDTYTNFYNVLPFSVDYVANVGNVDSVKSVSEVLEAQMEMHGTEYYSDEPVKVWLQLLDGNNTPLDDAVCYLWVYSPVNNLYITRANMYNIEYGLYAYDFDAPYVGGVYPAISICFFEASQEYHYADSFTPVTYASTTGSYTDTYAIDLSDQTIKETVAGNPKRIEFEYEIPGLCNGSNPDTLTGFSVGTNVKWQSATDDNLYISWWNWSSSSWVEMPNPINYDTDRLTISNSFETNNLTRDGYTDSDGTLRIQFKDTANTDGGATTVYIDYIDATCDLLAEPEFQTLKGSSEIHVTLDDASVSGYFTDITNVLFDNTTTYYEGNLQIDFTTFSRTLEPTDVVHTFDLPKDFTCEDVKIFRWQLSNGSWVEYEPFIDDDAFICEEDYTQNLVSLRWTRTVTYQETNDYQLVMYNRFERIIHKYDVNINSYYADMDLMCTNYLIMNGYGSKPTIPLTSDPNYGDVFANGCAHFWNTYNLFNNSLHTIIITKTAVVDGNTFDQYEESVHRVKGFYDILINDFVIGSGVINMYAQYTDFAPSASVAFQTWGPLSTNYNIDQFMKNNLTGVIWANENRTITSQEHLWVGGTEYSLDETVGKIVTRLVDTTDTPVDNALCIVRIAYPNNTLYLEQNMTHFNGSVMGGVYILDFNLSGEVGVHPYGIDCEIISGPSPKHYFMLDTFHVFGANVTKTAEAVWEYDTRTLTNATNIAGDIWGADITVNPNILTQIGNNIWNFAYRYIHGEEQ